MIRFHQTAHERGNSQSAMDIVEFAEKVLGVELNEWQKIILRRLYELPKDQKILILPPKRSLYYEGIVAARNALFENEGGNNNVHG